MSLRERQIREVLDEDLRHRQEVVRRQFKQAKLMNETYTPPNRFEKKVAFAIDKYFLELQKYADMAVNSVATEEGVEQASFINEDALRGLLSIYNELVAYLDTYMAGNPLNQRDIAVIENKFDALQPAISNLADRADGMVKDGKLANQLYAMDENLINRYYQQVNGVKNRNIVQKELLRQGIIAPEMLGVWREAGQGARTRDNELLFDYDPNAFEASPQRRPPQPSNIQIEDETEQRIAMPITRDTQIRMPTNKSEWALYLKDVVDDERLRVLMRMSLKDIGDEYTAYVVRSRDRGEAKGKRGYTKGLKTWLLLKTTNPNYLVRIFQALQNRLPTQEDGEPLLDSQVSGERNAEIEPAVEEEDAMLKFLLERQQSLLERGRQQMERSREQLSRDRMMTPPAYYEEQLEIAPFGRYDEYAIPRTSNAGRVEPIQNQPQYASADVTQEGEEEDIYQELGPMGMGRRRHHRRHPDTRSKMNFYGGFGQSEDLMFGLPYGMKKGMFLRPMDRQPVRFKTTDERDERGMSLEDRMMFLNQLDTRPVKEDMEMNSIHNYKRALDKKIKKMK